MGTSMNYPTRVIGAEIGSSFHSKCQLHERYPYCFTIRQYYGLRDHFSPNQKITTYVSVWPNVLTHLYRLSSNYCLPTLLGRNRITTLKIVRQYVVLSYLPDCWISCVWSPRTFHQPPVIVKHYHMTNYMLYDSKSSPLKRRFVQDINHKFSIGPNVNIFIYFTLCTVQ